MQTSVFWLKLGRCSKFSQPYPGFLSVFEMTVFMMKMAFSAAWGVSARSGSVLEDTGFITFPSFSAVRMGACSVPPAKPSMG